MTDPRNWQDFVRITGMFSAVHKTRISAFFGRLSASRSGRLILAEIDRRTTGPYRVLGFDVPYFETRTKHLDASKNGVFDRGVSAARVWHCLLGGWPGVVCGFAAPGWGSLASFSLRQERLGPGAKRGG